MIFPSELVSSKRIQSKGGNVNSDDFSNIIFRSSRFFCSENGFLKTTGRYKFHNDTWRQPSAHDVSYINEALSEEHLDEFHISELLSRFFPNHQFGKLVMSQNYIQVASKRGHPITIQFEPPENENNSYETGGTEKIHEKTKSTAKEIKMNLKITQNARYKASSENCHYRRPVLKKFSSEKPLETGGQNPTLLDPSQETTRLSIEQNGKTVTQCKTSQVWSKSKSSRNSSKLMSDGSSLRGLQHGKLENQEVSSQQNEQDPRLHKPVKNKENPHGTSEGKKRDCQRPKKLVHRILRHVRMAPEPNITNSPNEPTAETRFINNDRQEQKIRSSDSSSLLSISCSSSSSFPFLRLVGNDEAAIAQDCSGGDRKQVDPIGRTPCMLGDSHEAHFQLGKMNNIKSSLFGWERLGFTVTFEFSAGLCVIRPRKLKKAKTEWEALVIRRFGDTFYEIPKGHLEKGETLQDAAERELREETGLLNHVSICEPVLSEIYTVTDNPPLILEKTVHYFIAELLYTKPGGIQKKNRSFFWRTNEYQAWFGSKETETQEIRWVTSHEAKTIYWKSNTISYVVGKALRRHQSKHLNCF